VPDVRDYFSADVIPALETQQANFEELNGTSKINFIGWLVLLVGLIVIAFGLFMVYAARRTPLQTAAPAELVDIGT
jgi:hypothetical protein